MEKGLYASHNYPTADPVRNKLPVGRSGGRHFNTKRQQKKGRSHRQTVTVHGFRQQLCVFCRTESVRKDRPVLQGSTY